MSSPSTAHLNFLGELTTGHANQREEPTRRSQGHVHCPLALSRATIVSCWCNGSQTRASIKLTNMTILRDCVQAHEPIPHCEVGTSAHQTIAVRASTRGRGPIVCGVGPIIESQQGPLPRSSSSTKGPSTSTISFESALRPAAYGPGDIDGSRFALGEAWRGARAARGCLVVLPRWRSVTLFLAPFST